MGKSIFVSLSLSLSISVLCVLNWENGKNAFIIIIIITILHAFVIFTETKQSDTDTAHSRDKARELFNALKKEESSRQTPFFFPLLSFLVLSLTHK